MHRTTGYICDSDTFYSSPKFAVLHAKTTDEGWNPYTLVILVEITLFLHVQNERWGVGSIENCNSGPKTRCFACKNHRWGLGPIETSDSCANHAVLHAQNDRWGLGHTETCNSGANHDVLHAQSDRWSLGHIQTYNSVPKDAVLQSKSTDEGEDP